jgi:peptide-methionine (S)-S-oxide reductase
MKKIYLAGGCFWGVQAYFDQFDGIKKTTVGYANGNKDNPVYQDVKKGITGHAETIEIEYDENSITLQEILDKYFLVIDPVSVNQQGEDKGISYRTGIFYIDENDIEIIQNKMATVQKEYDKPLAVIVEKLHNFWDAEEYHQKYLEKNPGAYCHIPKSFFNN